MSWINPAIASHFDRKKKADERRLAFADRRRDFEITTIQELLEALNRLARNGTQAYLSDAAAADQNGIIGVTQLPADLDAAFLEIGLTITRLRGLLLDTELREETARVQAMWTSVAVPRPPTVAEAQALQAQAARATQVLQERLAERLRTLWQDAS